MGSGILLAILVVLWIVVLVPMLLHRGQRVDTRSTERLGSAMRILNRRIAAPDSAEASAGSTAGTTAGSTAGSTVMRVRRPYSAPTSAEVMARRQRTLIGLAGLAVLWLLLAVFVRSYFWTAQLVLDLILFAYIAYLRLETQREQERRERREARFASRARVPVVASVAEPAEVVAERPEGSWDPVPVPVPTYVNAATAPRRRYVPPAVTADNAISLDDDDPAFADIAEWTPQRAVGD